MTGRMKLALVFVVLAVAYGIAQPPLEGPMPIPVTAPEGRIQPVQNLEFPVMTRPRGQMNGQLMSQQNPIPAPSPMEWGNMAGMPAQPPTPAVSVAVLVPSDYPPSEDIPCTIRVSNNSGGDAHKVVLRVEFIGCTLLAVGGEQAFPKNFGTMKTGASEKIELKLRPTQGAASVSVKAFVSCEHGQVVKTNLSDRKLKVKTELPKVAVADEPIPVRVTIRNDGRVPITGARLVEQISDGFEYHKDIATGEPTKQPNQREWKIGTIAAGEQKVLQYLVTTTKGRQLTVSSTVDADNKVQSNDSASVGVGESQVRVILTGDERANANQVATYEMEVANTGTTTLTNVRAMGTVPDDCRLQGPVTKGYREYRGGVSWVIPKLAPGERYTVRWGLQSNTGKRHQIRGVAEAGRGVEHSAMRETYFPGEANLHMQSEFDSSMVALDRSGLLTVTVKNSGTAAATVRVSVVLPRDVVSFQQATPTYKQVGDNFEFEPRIVAAGKAESFTITFKGQQPGRAMFQMKLASDALDRPLEGTKKYVEIVRQ